MKSDTDLIAGVLSLLLPGLGQLYKQRLGRGAAFFFGSLLAWGLLLGWVIHLWAAYDALTLKE